MLIKVVTDILLTLQSVEAGPADPNHATSQALHQSIILKQFDLDLMCRAANQVLESAYRL